MERSHRIPIGVICGRLKLCPLFAVERVPSEVAERRTSCSGTAEEKANCGDSEPDSEQGGTLKAGRSPKVGH